MVNALDSGLAVCRFESISGSNRFLALLTLMVVASESGFVSFFDDQYNNEQKPVSYRRMHVGPNRRHDSRKKKKGYPGKTLQCRDISLTSKVTKLLKRDTARPFKKKIFLNFPVDKISD